MPKKKKDHHLQILSQLIFDLRKKNYMTLSEGETVYRIISQYVEL